MRTCISWLEILTIQANIQSVEPQLQHSSPFNAYDHKDNTTQVLYP